MTTTNDDGDEKKNSVVVDGVIGSLSLSLSLSQTNKTVTHFDHNDATKVEVQNNDVDSRVEDKNCHRHDLSVVLSSLWCDSISFPTLDRCP